MNTNSNVYTVIYSTVLVVVVAAILAFAAEGLKDKQNENVKLETITKVLTAAAQSDDNFTIDENTYSRDLSRQSHRRIFRRLQR